MIASLVSPYGDILSKLVGVGFNEWKENKRFQDLTAIARESLLRELKFNIELIDEIKKETTGNEIIPLVVQRLSTETFDRLVSADIPLGRMFDKKIETDFWGDFKLDQRDSNNVDGIKTNSDLLDRAYHRMKIFIIRVELGIDRTRLDYLRLLLHAAEVSLKQHL